MTLLNNYSVKHILCTYVRTYIALEINKTGYIWPQAVPSFDEF